MGCTEVPTDDWGEWKWLLHGVAMERHGCLDSSLVFDEMEEIGHEILLVFLLSSRV